MSTEVTRARRKATPMPKVGAMLTSVRETLSTLDAKDAKKDAGLRRLAEVYAKAIDDALKAAQDARALADKTEDPDDPFEVSKRLLNAFVKFSDSTTVLEQLGSKLQSTLESLGASPRVRATMARKPGGGMKPDAGSRKPEPTPFEKRRAAAAERAQQAQTARADGSSTVDAPA